MEYTDFGFKKVRKEEKTQLVGEVFDAVASSYDKMNDWMSLGLHRRWKNHLIQTMRPKPHEKIIDVAGGTGDISRKILDYSPQSIITLADINHAMIHEGAKKHPHLPIDWVCASAEDLPFEDESFDAYVISFGLRNVTERAKALKEAFRVLKKGGRFYCLEFSKVQSPPMAQLYNFYSFHIIPLMGEKIAQSRDAYQYLVESIALFPTQAQLIHELNQAGFKMTKYQNLQLGIVAIHQGVKI